MFIMDAQHFVRDPHWTWYILFYFFFAGIAGGSYLLATLFRLRGEPTDEPIARVGYYVTFGALLACPPMLILDLGSPLRFWHMMVSMTPDTGPINFKYWSPMSLGVWGLLAFNAFAGISFIEALVRDDKLRIPLAKRAVALLDGALGRVVMILGSIFGMFIAGYTGVLLSVSNQPLWSDTWALGGLFLASGLSCSAALLMLLSRYRKGATSSLGVLHVQERLFTVLEIVFIILLVVSLVGTGALGPTFGMPWTVLWVIAFASLIPGVIGLARHGLSDEHADHDEHVAPAAEEPAGRGGVAVASRAVTTTTTAPPVLVPILVLVGVLALRAAIIFPVAHW